LALIRQTDERCPGGLAVAQRHGPRRRLEEAVQYLLGCFARKPWVVAQD
jgi:hypothetical protein